MTRSAIMRAAAIASILTAPCAQAQTAPDARRGAAPDACALMPRGDLEALFPGRTVTDKGPTLSPVYKGPQYNEGCAYSVSLPSPTSPSETVRPVSITVVQWGQGSSGRSGAAATFGSLRESERKLAAGNPGLGKRIENLPDIGDEAFLDARPGFVTVRGRKGDLIVTVMLDDYSPQMQTNAEALVRQALGRWQEGVGIVPLAGPVARNETVEVPPDTRRLAQAPLRDWPDACGLLRAEDIRAVFPDATVGPARATKGTLTLQSREKYTAQIPNPIACAYDVKKTVATGNRKATITANTVTLQIQDVAATEELARKSYQAARKVNDAKTELPDLGDEASLSPLNRIYLRRGRLNISLHVMSDMRDRAQFEDATKRLNELVRRVVERLPAGGVQQSPATQKI